MATTVSYPRPTAQAQAIADLTGYEDAATLRWQQACVQATNTLTALPNGRYVSVRMERMRQGLELAQRSAVTLPDEGEELSAVVRSGNNLYQVDTHLLTCTCADYRKHLQACKHLLAVEIHVGALGLLPPLPEPAADTPAVVETVTPALVPDPAPTPLAPPTAAQWPTSEAPASMNVKLRVGNNFELMYTARDTNDRDLQARMTPLLPWLAEVMAACEANYEARKQPEAQAKATPPPAPAERNLDEQIAAAITAAMQAQATRRNGANAPATPEAHAKLTAAPHEHEPSWCPKHQLTMRWHDGNSRGPGWFSHQLADGSYCKGK
jgi:hypothetical protein